MPLFDNTSNVVITGGAFYDAAGDIHIQNNHQQFAIQHRAQAAQHALGSPETSRQSIGCDPDNVNGGRVLSGVVRNTRHTENRSRPYDVLPSLRSQINSQRDLETEDNHDVSSSAPWGISLASAPAQDYPRVSPSRNQYHGSAFPAHEFGFQIPPPSNSFPSNDTPAHYTPYNNQAIQYRHSGASNSHTWQRSTANESTTTIDGGTFIGGNVNNVYRSGQTGIHILHRAVALEAMHDSADSYPQPRCHPETRSEMLDKLWNWAIKSEWSEKKWVWQTDKMMKGLPVLWLHGPAGAGKSAIMRTLAERLANNKQLGGSFFFKRGHATRGNAQKLFTTIAYQLALCVPQLKSRISQIVEDDPSSVGRLMSVQMQSLIVAPCLSESNIQIPVVLIDGLDECEGHLVQQEILRLISYSMHEHLPLKFVIASRPEPDIRKIFEDSLYEGLYHPFNVEQSFEDIKKYLRHEFARIHRDHETMATVAMPWPSQKILDQFVNNSSGYFIYASTVIKFVDDNNSRPTDQLEHLQKTSSSKSPFSGLDQLYNQILSRVPDDLPLLSILKAITFSKFRLRSITVEKLLELQAGDVQLTLRNLHSVLDVPDDSYDWRGITGYHASFQDFLQDAERAGKFYVGAEQLSVDLAHSVFKALTYQCDCSSINQDDPVSFDLHVLDISDFPPLAEFVPLIRRMNPIFSLARQMYYTCPMVEGTLELLKKIGNPPADLVNMLEDYQFMLFVTKSIDNISLGFPEDYIDSDCSLGDLEDDIDSDCSLGDPEDDTDSDCSLGDPEDNIDSDCSLGDPEDGFPVLCVAEWEQLYQCPLLCRIVQACILGFNWNLVHFHILLDISWDELRAAICTLRPFTGADEKKIVALLKCMARHLLSDASSRAMSLELARGSIRVLNDIRTGQQPSSLWPEHHCWSRYVRASPCSLELLQDIRDFVPFKSNKYPVKYACTAQQYHDVLQWLKAFPNPPQDVIEIWQNYLKAACDDWVWLRRDDPDDEWRWWQNRLQRKGLFLPNQL
ncbi:hypothetical protein B0H13DRAFT_760564 [Mycena leptocephala]|nr:hypothetical protein B0H13DRAFT_760564 [Mycena leptocephala]